MKLAEARKARNLTQQNLADLMSPKINRSLIAQIESGHRRAYPKFKRQAAKYLGVPEAELFPEANGD